MDERTAREIRSIQSTIYADAEAHNLFICDSGFKTKASRRQAQVFHVIDELKEALEAVNDDDRYAEEMADAWIMILSQTAHDGIDIGEKIVKKMEVNHNRPVGHEDGRWFMPYKIGD